MAEPSTFTAVDLSRLPAPTIVETLDFDTIYGQMLAALQALVPTFDATVESDPAIKLLEVAAYREMLLRARVNDAARAVMPAYAIGADLDNLAALMGVVRLLITPANAQTNAPAVYESDEDFRRRLVLAPEGYSVAGPEGAYIFHALSAASDVLDASATSPTTGEVRITILSRVGTGAASLALLDTVLGYVSAETRRPLTDHVTIQSAQIVEYAVKASITTFAGPDGSIVIADARARLPCRSGRGYVRRARGGHGDRRAVDRRQGLVRRRQEADRYAELMFAAQNRGFRLYNRRAGSNAFAKRKAA